MKKIILSIFFLTNLYFRGESQPIFSDDGHPEHVIAGTIIGGGISYLVYRKTGNKFKSWLIGAASATALGYAKEALDPSFGLVRSNKDALYTALGGAVGASIVFPLRSRKKVKTTPNIMAAFEESSLRTLSYIYPDK